MSTKDKIKFESLPALTVSDFRKLIGEKANSKSESIFKNGSPENANIVAANIYKHSNEVRLYAFNMNGDISNSLPDYMDELLNFLNRGGTKITVVLDKVEDEKSLALKHLLNFQTIHSESKISVLSASEEFRAAVRTYEVDGSNDIHFMTGNEKMFRLEHNNSSKSAYFSFNNSKLTQILNTVFDANLSSCTKIKMP